MKAHIIHRPEADRYDIYLFNDDRTQVGYYNDDGLLIWESYVQGSVPKSWIVFDAMVYEALRRAMVGEAIDQDDSLRDARHVRDRLLSMVESEWQSRQLEKR